MSMDRADFKRLANRMSKAFRDSNGGGIVERFEAVSKLLFIKMVDERMVAGTWPGSPQVAAPALQWRPGDVSRTVYERARELWISATGGARASVLQGGKNSFPKDVEAVARIVRYMEPYALDRVGVDVKGYAYEELLRDTFEKNDNQQYFTPRHLMDFVVELADPTPDDVVCDPASGSGGFLVGALSHVAARHGGRTVRVLGADIDERMAWVARINVFLHGADPAVIAHLPGAGSLQPISQLQRALPKNTITTILANPPFGSDMTDRAALESFATGRGRTTRRRGVLFVERCLELLKPGGLLAVVIDDSILNLEGNADLRQLVRQWAIVEAVISLPDVTFMPYSTAKSSVLLVRKRTSESEVQGPVFMADVENVGNRPNGDPLYQDVPAVEGVRPLLSDLPDVLAAWKSFRHSGELPASDVTIFAANIDAYADEPEGDRLDVNFFHPARGRAAQLLDTAGSPSFTLEQLFDFENAAVRASELFGDTTIDWIGLGDIVAGTGEFEPVHLSADRIKSSAHQYLAGDILVSKLRPRLRKAIYVPTDSPGGLCSAELLVLRKKVRPPVDFLPEYVVYLLRSDLGYGQQVYQITGVGRPRVGVSALKRLRVPVPAEAEQRLVVQRMDSAFRRYRELHAEADALRAEAQHLLRGAYSSSVEAVTGASASASASSLDIDSGTSARAAV